MILVKSLQEIKIIKQVKKKRFSDNFNFGQLHRIM